MAELNETLLRGYLHRNQYFCPFSNRQQLLDAAVQMKQGAALVVGIIILGVKHNPAVQGRIKAKSGMTVRNGDNGIKTPVVETGIGQVTQFVLSWARKQPAWY